MMLLAICPTPMPSASAACCAVRAASSNITGAWGWPAAIRAAHTRFTPSGKGVSVTSDMASHLRHQVLRATRSTINRLAPMAISTPPNTRFCVRRALADFNQPRRREASAA